MVPKFQAPDEFSKVYLILFSPINVIFLIYIHMLNRLIVNRIKWDLVCISHHLRNFNGGKRFTNLHDLSLRTAAVWWNNLQVMKTVWVDEMRMDRRTSTTMANSDVDPCEVNENLLVSDVTCSIIPLLITMLKLLSLICALTSSY